MRILFITRGFPPKGLWGSEGYSEGLARGFARRGHQVDVFFPSEGDGGIQVESVAPGLRTVEFAAPERWGRPFVDSYRDVRQDEALRAWLERHGPYDRVHFTTLAGGVSVGMIGAARPHTRELLVTLTDLLPHCHRGQLLDANLRSCSGPAPAKCSRCVMTPGPHVGRSLARRAKAWTVRLLSPFGRIVPRLATPAAFAMRARFFEERFAEVDHFVIAAEAAREEFVSRGMDPARITALPYGMEPRLYEGLDRVPPPDGRLRFGLIAQFAPHKGIDVFIDAVALLPPELRERMVVQLYGKPTSQHYPRYGKQLVERIEASDLPVELRGSFAPDQIGQVMAQFDFVVLPSIWLESLPLVLLHARGVGLPILGSSMGGVGPFIEHGVDGLVVEAGSAAAWSDALRRVLEDDELRSRLQQGGARRGLPMLLEDHLDVLSSLEAIRSYAAHGPAG